MNTPRPEGPWEVVGSDLFDFKGVPYILLVDYFSRWIEVVELRDMTTESVLHRMKRVFARLGIPREIRTDNGPCYASQTFRAFSEQWKFQHVTSSPRYPESNGMAERAVRTVKDMWMRETDKNSALMAYRSSPLESGYSPAQLLYGRQIRTKVYDSGRAVDLEEFRRRDLEVRERQTKSTNKRRRAKVMEELKAGDRVWVKESKNAKGH